MWLLVKNNYLKIHFNSIFELTRCISQVSGIKLKDGHQFMGKNHPYKCMYPWKTKKEFTDYLYENICFNDGKLIAIDKPWGVGIHRSELMVTKQNANHITGASANLPKYHIDEALDHLKTRLNFQDELKVIKTIDRFSSGIILLARVNDENTQNRIKNSIARSKQLDKPMMTFCCITKGWPINIPNESVLKERIGIKLVEVDELGDYKEPIIIKSKELSRRMRKRIPLKDGINVKTSIAELRILDCNKNLGVSFIEVAVNSQKWGLVQCYISHKASFIIGDQRFSKRVQDILGVPVSYSPNKIVSLNFDNNYEPLPKHIGDKLHVKKNSDVPLLVHHHQIRLTNYWKNKDLIIKTKCLPHHFLWSLERLGLNNYPINDNAIQSN